MYYLWWIVSLTGVLSYICIVNVYLYIYSIAQQITVVVVVVTTLNKIQLCAIVFVCAKRRAAPPAASFTIHAKQARYKVNKNANFIKRCERTRWRRKWVRSCARANKYSVYFLCVCGWLCAVCVRFIFFYASWMAKAVWLVCVCKFTHLGFYASTFILRPAAQYWGRSNILFIQWLLQYNKKPSKHLIAFILWCLILKCFFLSVSLSVRFVLALCE